MISSSPRADGVTCFARSGAEPSRKYKPVTAKFDGGLRVFDDRLGHAFAIKVHHAIALWISDAVAKDCAADLFLIGVLQKLGQSVPKEDVVTQRQRGRYPENPRRYRPVPVRRARLHDIGKLTPHWLPSPSVR